MKRLIIAAALSLAVAFAAEAAPLPAGVTDASYVAPDGSRTLSESIEIAAPPMVVWKLFTDVAAIKATGVSDAWVDLRGGGSLEESLGPQFGRGDAMNIRHGIIAYVPGRLMILQNQNTPAGLPGREAYKTIIQIVQIEDLGGGRSRLTLTGTGYGAGAEYDGLYAFFQEHNAQGLTTFKAVAEKLAASR
ncbi:MAG: hypothetical protein JWP35_4760 [Caulobacter sp.]|nr:hypothetical protein [Caulobacter sp.]